MAIGTDAFQVSLPVSILPPQSDGRTTLSPASKEGRGTGEMLRPLGKWGPPGALDLEAQPLLAANLQPARAQQHLWPAQPHAPSCLRPRQLLPPPWAQPWSDGVPRGLLRQEPLLRRRRRFLTRCPLLFLSRIKSQGHWGACVQHLGLCRGKEGACQAKRGDHQRPGCSSSIAPPTSPCLIGDPANPDPQGCPCPVSRAASARIWAGFALGGCLWWHGSPPNAPALPAQHRTPGAPRVLPPWPSIPGLSPHQPLSPSRLCSPRASPLLAAVPHVSGCTRSSPACPVHRNTDLFAQHPPFAHLHARKGVKSPRPGTALQAVGETRSPPQNKGDTATQQGPGCCDTQGGPDFGDTMPRLASRWQWPPLSPGLPRRAGVPAGQHPGVRALPGPSWPRWDREDATGWARGHGPYGQRDVVPADEGLRPSSLRDRGPHERGAVVPMAKGTWPP